MSAKKMKRRLLFAALVLMVWAMLAQAFFQQPEKSDRVAILLTAIMIAILAIVISKRSAPPRSRSTDLGGADGYDSHHHGADNGGSHGSSDGGDGGGDGGH